MTENHTGRTMDFWEDELEKYRVELTSVLKPDRYFDKFRAERILDETDAEEIHNETLHPTRAKKAGRFLDILRTRGMLAYQLLLDCLEADHPELYKQMTGRAPEPKPWTYGLQKQCSCECHGDGISLDLIDEYRKEKQMKISLKQELDRASRSLDQVLEERVKLRHEKDTLKRQLAVFQAEATDIQKLKDDIKWRRYQICDLQGKAYETQTQLMSANDKLRKVSLENNSLKNKLHEAEAKLHFSRQKSLRLEKARTESTEKMKNGNALKDLVEQLQLELERKKIEEARKTATTANQRNSSYELEEQTKLEIMIADKEEAVTKCEEAVKELQSVRKQLYDAYDLKEKLEADKEEMATTAALLKEELTMVTERLQMAQDELTQVSGERSQVVFERNRAFEETARSLVERDDLVRKLNNERTSYLKQARQYFKSKAELQRLKREKQLAQDRPPSVLSTDGSNDSKRSSAAADPGAPGAEPAGSATPDRLPPSSSPTPPSTSSAAVDGRDQAMPRRSISLADMKYATFDDDDEDLLDDYEYPAPYQRERTKPVADLPGIETVTRKLSNASRGGDRHSESASVDLRTRPISGESVEHSVSNAQGEERMTLLDDIPSTDSRVHTLWPGFDFVQEKVAQSGDQESKEEDVSPKLRLRAMKESTNSDSMQVNSGSIRDKFRSPAPRLSSHEYTDYMADVNHHKGQNRSFQT